MDSLYLVSNGVMVRKANSLTFVNKEGKRHLPIESVGDIYCLGRITLTSGAVSLLMKKTNQSTSLTSTASTRVH